MPLTPAEIDRIRPIVLAKVAGRASLIGVHHHIGRDDLEQEAMIRALAAHEKYQPPYSYTSWIGRAADAGILDVLKKANGQGNRPRPQMQSFEPEDAPFFHESDSKLGRNSESFASVALAVARKTIRRWPSGGGRHHFERPSIAAALVLKRECKWSWRGLVLMLASPSLQEAVELPGVPAYQTMLRWEHENKRKVSLIHGRVRRVFEAYS